MPKGKRQHAGGAATHIQPVKFGIQHFFTRHASTQSSTTPILPSDPAATIVLSPAPVPESKPQEDVQCNPAPIKTPEGEIRAENPQARAKRMRLSPSEVLPHTQDDGCEEIVWRASPTAERLQSCSSMSTQGGQRPALRPCNSNMNAGRNSSSLQSVCTLVSPCSKISPGIAGKLETWLSSSTVGNKRFEDKENYPTTQVTTTQKTLKKASSTPQKKSKARTSKKGTHAKPRRKVLLHLLDQVESVIDKVSDKELGKNSSCSLVESENHKEVQSKETSNISVDELDKVLIIPQSSEFCIPEVESRQTITPTEKPNIHYLVLEVCEFEGSQHSYPEKVVRLLDETNATERVICLRDEWCFTAIRPGDTVNVIGDFEPDGKCVIDHEKNLLVLHPDVLVSGSRVGASFTCPRRAVLDERIKSMDVSLAALLGTMLHRLFQAALTTSRPSRAVLQSHAKKIIVDNIGGLYAIGGDEKEALARLEDSIPIMLDWLRIYKDNKTSLEPNVDFGIVNGKHHVSISEVVDIEEMVWSPKYGLKGMIDASLQVRRNGDKIEHMPLEFKTGKATSGQAAMEHRAQVILYTLLMSDRYADDVNRAILYYLHSKETQGVQVQQADLTGLMMRRNEHANNLLLASSTRVLPPMLQNSRLCQGCRMVDICTVYHKVQEGGTGETSGLGELFESLTSHLSQKHGEFLQHWDHLIDLEAQVHHSSQTEVWRTPSGIREEQGRCISCLIITSEDEDNNSPGTFIYCFKRASSPCNDRIPSLVDQSFSLGDYVVLSTESGQAAIAGGVVRNFDSESLTVSVSRSLKLPGKRNLNDANRVFKELWRIDKDDSSSCFALMRYNLLQLFVKDGARRSRELIVDLEVPNFDNHGMGSQDPAASYVRSVSNLNHDQRSAVMKILAARDYALILGMPGTGKTSTIVHAVKALLARGSSVLLASYTNSAVDNILLKLKHQDVDFIRVGRSEAIHPELAQHAVGVNVSSVDELRSKIDTAQVVGATCLGITHALFTKRKFDICIIDEAGQITLPVCLGPLIYAHTFVLVGDHYQLPPLIQNAEAREKGMAISLFRMLSEAHPQAVSALQCQYRMCADIMNLCNTLIYGNRLRCGSSEVADARLHINIPRNLPLWTQQVLDASRSVLFLNMDDISSQEKRYGNAIQNIAEGSVLVKIVCALSEGGVDMHCIGVISPYKAQVDYIKRRLADRKLLEIEVHTIDKYQGRDKDCILVSFVRSRNQRLSGSLLTDWHRINVAITRAKKKLIMIGSVKTLSSVPLLRLLIQQVDEQGGLLKLPEDTLTSL